MIFSGTTSNDIYEWIDKKNNGDDTDYLNGKQDTEEAIDVFQSLYRRTSKNVYRLFLYLQQHLCMRVADSQSLYRAFIVLRNDEIITLRLSQHFSTKDAARRAFNRTGKPNVEYHLTINRVKPLNPNTDIYYDRTLSNVEIKVREYDLSEFNDRDIKKGIIDEIIALLTYGTNKNENKQYMNMNKQVIRLTEGDLHKIIKESVSKILTELDWKTYMNAARARQAQGNGDKASNLETYANNQFNQQHFGNKGYYGSNVNGNSAMLQGGVNTKGGEMHDTRDYGANFDGTMSTTKASGKQIHGYGKELVGNNRGYANKMQQRYSYDQNNLNGLQNVTDDYKLKMNNVGNDLDGYYNNKSKYVKGQGWQ